MSSPITRILAAIATAMLVLLIYMTLTVGITGSLFASDRNTTSNSAPAATATYSPAELLRKRSSLAPGDSSFFEDLVVNIVEDIESWASIDRQNSLNDLLDEQDETPVPALFVPPPPSPPSRPSPPPNHLVEDCVNPIYRLHHSNDTCLDWKKTCINGHFVIKNGAVCNGFSEDPASGPGVYVDAKCSLHHQDLKRCLPWNTRHQHERCRKRNYFGPKRQAVCKEWMKNDSDLFHNSLSPFWVDPQCGSLQVRLEQVDRREHDHFEGGERCRTWHWLEAAKKCRVRTGMYEMPHYKRSPFCVAACLRDPLCPGDAKHEARARIAGLCPTLYAQNELFSQRLPEVCEPLKYGVNGGDVMIKGAFYST